MATLTTPISDIPLYCRTLGEQALAASRSLATASGAQRQAALHHIADAIDASSDAICAANAQDLAAAPGFGLSNAMIDRLRIDSTKVAAIAKSVREIAEQPDPVGAVLEGRVLANGIRLEKRRVSIGVVLIIFESRPNVTSDAAALCIKSGNAAILRGGKEAIHSNAALAACVKTGLQKGGINPNAVQLVETSDRSAVSELLQLDHLIDICIPRGGESLIRAVVDQSRIPVIKHYTGNCHVYVDEHADPEAAVDICVNAKTQRTGVCNAAETILVHRRSGLVSRISDALIERGVEIRGDAGVCDVCASARPAAAADWATEYLDMIVAMRVVDSFDEAVDHINTYGSKHTDAIVTTRLDIAERFIQTTDTANAMINCSTRFSDGGEYGLGAEIGISTDKLHARGPMGAADLCTYKWVARGNGQIRS